MPGSVWLPNKNAGLTTSPGIRLTARLRPEPPRVWKGRPPGERAAHWRALLAEGVYPSRAALARAEGVSRAAVTQALGPLNRAVGVGWGSIRGSGG